MMVSRACLFAVAAAVAGCAAAPQAAPAAPPVATLANRPDKHIVVAAMARAAGGIAVCYDRYRQTGVADMQITVDAEGRVTSAEARGDLAGTSEAGCISDVVRHISFPARPCARSFSYPFVLH
jgi:hypothetical protein